MPTPKPALSHAILLSTTFDIPAAVVLHLIPGTNFCLVCCCELNHKQVYEVKSAFLSSNHVGLHDTSPNWVGLKSHMSRRKASLKVGFMRKHVLRGGKADMSAGNVKLLIQQSCYEESGSETRLFSGRNYSFTGTGYRFP
jgi:hypothetical protein